jgi:hypothetical protein
VKDSEGTVERKRPNVKLLILAGAVILVSVLIYSSMQQARLRYEVCVNFRGNAHCATASGATAEEAIHSAHDIDCSQLANGRDENMVCLATEPSQVRSLTGEKR